MLGEKIYIRYKPYHIIKKYSLRVEKYPCHNSCFYQVFIIYDRKVVMQSYHIYPEDRILSFTKNEFKDIINHSNHYGLTLEQFRNEEWF